MNVMLQATYNSLMAVVYAIMGIALIVFYASAITDNKEAKKDMKQMAELAMFCVAPVLLILQIMHLGSGTIQPLFKLSEWLGWTLFVVFALLCLFVAVAYSVVWAIGSKAGIKKKINRLSVIPPLVLFSTLSLTALVQAEIIR